MSPFGLDLALFSQAPFTLLLSPSWSLCFQSKTVRAFLTSWCTLITFHFPVVPTPCSDACGLYVCSNASSPNADSRNPPADFVHPPRHSLITRRYQSKGPERVNEYPVHISSRPDALWPLCCSCACLSDLYLWGAAR